MKKVISTLLKRKQAPGQEAGPQWKQGEIPQDIQKAIAETSGSESLTAADQTSSSPPTTVAKRLPPKVPPRPPRKTAPKEPSRHDAIVSDAIEKRVQDESLNKKLALYINRIVAARERGMNDVADTALDRLKKLMQNYMDSPRKNQMKAELAAVYVYELLKELKDSRIIAKYDEIFNDLRILNARFNDLNKMLAAHKPLDGKPSPKPVQPAADNETPAIKNRELDKLEQQLLKIKADNDAIINPKINLLEKAILKYGSPDDEFIENFNAVKNLREKQNPDEEINGALDQLLHEMVQHREMVRDDHKLLQSAQRKMEIIDEFIEQDSDEISQEFLRRYELIRDNLEDIVQYGKIDQNVHAEIVEIVDAIKGIMQKFDLTDSQEGEVDNAGLNETSAEQSSDELKQDKKQAWTSRHSNSSSEDQDTEENSYGTKL